MQWCKGKRWSNKLWINILIRMLGKGPRALKRNTSKVIIVITRPKALVGDMQSLKKMKYYLQVLVKEWSNSPCLQIRRTASNRQKKFHKLYTRLKWVKWSKWNQVTPETVDRIYKDSMDPTQAHSIMGLQAPINFQIKFTRPVLWVTVKLILRLMSLHLLTQTTKWEVLSIRGREFMKLNRDTLLPRSQLARLTSKRPQEPTLRLVRYMDARMDPVRNQRSSTKAGQVVKDKREAVLRNQGSHRPLMEIQLTPLMMIALSERAKPEGGCWPSRREKRSRMASERAKGISVRRVQTPWTRAKREPRRLILVTNVLTPKSKFLRKLDQFLRPNSLHMLIQVKG